MIERYSMKGNAVFSRTRVWALFCLLIVLFSFAQVHYLYYSYDLSGEMKIFDRDLLDKGLREGSMGRRAGIISLGLMGLFWLVSQGKNKFQINGFLGFVVMFFFLWIFMSIFWSEDYMLTARRSVSFSLLWLVALGFNMRFRERDAFLFLLFACSVYMFFGLAIELSLGTFPPSNVNYRFSGTLHPNHQAWNCAGVVLAGAVLWQTEPRDRLRYLMLAVVGFIFLFLTRSRTSLTACLVALLVYAFLVSDKKRIAFFAMGVVALLCILLIIFGPGPILDSFENTLFLGRMANTETLTGRTPVWDFGIDYFLSRPLQGYGFNAFASAKRMYELETIAGWAAPALHSEYLSLLLGVGLIGLTSYLFIMTSGFLRTLKLFRRSHDRYYAVSCAILVFYFAAMVLENLNFNPNVFTFIVLVILTRRAFIRENT